MTPWLSVIGIGEDGTAGLSPSARALLDAAEVVVGGSRHLGLVAGPAEKLSWPSPFAGAQALLESLRGRRVVVLASGDPMWFGIGATLARWLDPDDYTVLPHPGAFALAAALLKWPLQECLCLTAHGRPVDGLALHLAPGQKLLVLAEDGRTPELVADLLRQHGFGPSPMAVCEHLGGLKERVSRALAADWQDASADLNVIAVDCIAAPGVRSPSRLGGLPDDAFLHDGQLTKREIRAVTLSALAPLPGELLWDIGAGCGSVAIEWMRAGGRAVAVEPRPERCDRIARNAARLGVPALEVLRAMAPDGLPGGTPDAVFVGGGISVPGVLQAGWAALAARGRLVANAVTAEGEAELLRFRSDHGGDLIRLSVSRLAPTGGFHTWHPAMPVTQYVGWKP
jgi:precorrin-6Y C5,15-methyltransferase (decarboxylating)